MKTKDTFTEAEQYSVWCDRVKTLFTDTPTQPDLTRVPFYTPEKDLHPVYWERFHRRGGDDDDYDNHPYRTPKEGEREVIPCTEPLAEEEEESSSEEEKEEHPSEADYPYCFYARMMYCIQRSKTAGSQHPDKDRWSPRRRQEEKLESKEEQRAIAQLRDRVVKNGKKKERLARHQREQKLKNEQSLMSLLQSRTEEGVDHHHTIPYVDISLETKQNRLYDELCELLLSLKKENKMREGVKQALIYSRTLRTRYSTVLVDASNDGDNDSDLTKYFVAPSDSEQGPKAEEKEKGDDHDDDVYESDFE